VHQVSLRQREWSSSFHERHVAISKRQVLSQSEWGVWGWFQGYVLSGAGRIRAFADTDLIIRGKEWRRIGRMKGRKLFDCASHKVRLSALTCRG
jgi:hypothetical protein